MGYAKTKPEEEIEITSRHIPGSILQLTTIKIDNNKKRITSKDKFALSLYYYLPFAPIDKDLASLLGGGETEESARQTREKLESFGLLKIEPKLGKKRTAILSLPVSPTGTKQEGIVVDKLIRERIKGFTCQLIAAVEIGFSKEGRGIGWMAWKIGTLKITYQKAKERLGNQIAILAYQLSSTQENYILNPRKLYTISKDIISKDVLSKDNTLGPSALNCSEAYPLKENSPIKKEYNMSERIPFDTPAPTGYVEEHLRLWKLQSSMVVKRNEFKKKKNKFNPPKYSIEVITDMNWIKKELPFIHSPGPETKAYWKDSRIINALIYGPSNYLDPDEIRAILNKMIGATMTGGNCPLTEIVIRQRFLDQKFNQDERRELYRNFNNMLSVQYERGRGEKKELAWGMRTYKGWSYLAELWMVPRVKVMHQMPIDFKSVERELELAVDIIPKKIMPEDKPRLARNIINLKKRYFQEFRPRMNGNSIGRNTWPEFFGEFLDSIEDSAEIINVGWFNPDNKPVKNFLYDIGVRQPVARPELRMTQPAL